MSKHDLKGVDTSKVGNNKYVNYTFEDYRKDQGLSRKGALKSLGNIKLSLISVLLLEAIYFFNFTTPEFNVNVCQLPFWSLVIYYSWKIYDAKEIHFYDCFLIGLFAAIGFLSKYLFVYLLLSISLLFIYVIYKKFKIV